MVMECPDCGEVEGELQIEDTGEGRKVYMRCEACGREL